jgi:hypothetical protein
MPLNSTNKPLTSMLSDKGMRLVTSKKMTLADSHVSFAFIYNNNGYFISKFETLPLEPKKSTIATKNGLKSHFAPLRS